MSAHICTRMVAVLTAAMFLATGVTPSWGREEIAKLTPSDGAAGLGQGFGAAVAISGDYIVVGAPLDGTFTQHSGAAYVFEREGDAWVEQRKLTSSEPRFEGLFGASVDIDGNRIVVGEPRWEFAQCYFGRAYVFKRIEGSWVEEVRLDSPGTTYDCFGVSVSIAGDRVAIGAPSEASYSGVVYVFRHEGAGWILEARLTASDGAPDDEFGGSVSMDENLVVAGASGDDDAGSGSGSAYVFRRLGGSWTQEGKLTASDAAATDFFGSPVSVKNDAIVVAATGKDDVGFNSGAAYVFRVNAGTWVQEAKLMAASPASKDMFGAGTVDGDLIVVGAVGSAYLFRRSGGTWSEADRLVPSEGSPALGGRGSIEMDVAVVPGDGAAYVFSLAEVIPAVSAWGLVALALLTLIAGTVAARGPMHPGCRH